MTLYQVGLLYGERPTGSRRIERHEIGKQLEESQDATAAALAELKERRKFYTGKDELTP